MSLFSAAADAMAVSTSAISTPSTATVFTATGVITLTTPASGIFTYVPSTADVQTAANYNAQFKAVLSGGGILHTDIFQLGMLTPI